MRLVTLEEQSELADSEFHWPLSFFKKHDPQLPH